LYTSQGQLNAKWAALLRKSASIKWRSEGLVASTGQEWVNKFIDSQSVEKLDSLHFYTMQGWKNVLP
jgi:hypothetical protein